MQKYHSLLAIAGIGLLLSGCTSGNSAQVPPFQSVNVPNSTKLEFAVGTANLGGGVTGLNTVVSFRQSTGSTIGLAGTLVNTPTITGPPGFVVPASSAAGVDAGTNHISGQPQQSNGAAAPPADTFNETGGAFEYGFAPANSDTSGSANYPQFTAFGPSNSGLYPAGAGGFFENVYTEPMYAATPATTYPFLGGPPAFPFFQDGTQQPGFLGYPSGFTVFQGAAPVAGTYGLTLLIPGNSAATASKITTSARLASAALLPAFPAPAFAEDGLGGGTVTVDIPAGVTETLVYVVDTSPSSSYTNFYTLLFTGAGVQSAKLPANLGPLHAQSITPPSASAGTPGDPYFVYAAGFDYPAFQAAPPGNRSATPTITGANGQADVTLSAVTAVAAYGGAVPGAIRRLGRR